MRKVMKWIPVLIALAALAAPVLWAAPAAAQSGGGDLSNFVFLPFLTGAAGTPPPPPPPPPPPVSGAFFVEPDTKTGSAAIAIDGAGGSHLAYAYYLPAAEHPAAVYLYCPPGVDCTQGGWSGVSMGDGVNEVQLALTSAGQPRLLFRTYSATSGYDNDYYYAECNQNCTDPAEWSVTYILNTYGTSIFSISDLETPQRYFALDPQGRPRFVYFDRNYFIEPDHLGAFYVYCDAGCSDSANWFETQISLADGFDYEVYSYPSLTFSSTGQPRLAALMDVVGGDISFYYSACDSGCSDGGNWDRALLFERGSGTEVSWDLELDGSGRPRIAFYKGATLDDTGDKLYYLYCNANCLSAGSWQSFYMGLGGGMGKHPDLEFNAQGQPRIAYIRNMDDGLGYAWCNSNCDSGAAAWQDSIVETASVLDAEYPVPRPPHCDAAIWRGITPVMSFDGGGNPRVAYDAVYDTRCLYDDPNDGLPAYYVWHQLWHSVRGVFFPQP